MKEGTTHVLVVEDEEQIGKLIEMMLIQAGYAVTSINYPIDALLWAIEDSTKVDLVITDVFMPVISGPEMVEALWSKRPEIPVIFVTGSDEQAESERDLTGPLKWRLQKPFRKEELLDRVLAALGGRS